MKKLFGGLFAAGFIFGLHISSPHAADKVLVTPEHDAEIQSVSLTQPPNPGYVASEHDEVHSLIRRQLQAIKERDAEIAYGLTGDKLHKKYDDATEYLNAMRFDYRAIYNHKVYSFGEQSEVGDAVLQQVSIEDQYGDDVLVLFRVEDDEGELEISSFAVIYSDVDPL